MSSRQRLMLQAKKRKTEALNALIKARINRFDSYCVSPSLSKIGQTLPKFQRAYSQSKMSTSHDIQRVKKDIQKTHNKMYNKLSSQLKQIKQTLKQSLVNVSQPKKKKSVKRKAKVITEISEPDNLFRGSDQKYRPSKNYYDVLKHIEQLKQRNKPSRSNQVSPSRKDNEEQKTLFYGIDYIDKVEFKIKIKLSKTTYYLFAKNNTTKIMMEMSYTDYMRMHLGQLKGNPCNILRYLTIDNNKIKLRLKNSPHKKAPNSLKSYLGYY